MTSQKCDKETQMLFSECALLEMKYESLSQSSFDVEMKNKPYLIGLCYDDHLHCQAFS